jgi:ABC-type Fe3+/spermidine/putrescine transport system ATPase subunit
VSRSPGASPSTAKLFLLDEPLSALDANLREHMQMELRQLQQRLGVTTLVVTHDQKEALTMADIVIVMEGGRIRQMGAPMEIYRNPADAFVAGFIGSSNLLPARLIDGGTLEVSGRRIALSEDDRVNCPPGRCAPGNQAGGCAPRPRRVAGKRDLRARPRRKRPARPRPWRTRGHRPLPAA